MNRAPPDPPVVACVTISNDLGLHARAAAKFVKCAGQFASEILVMRDGMTVPATSIMGLLMLAAGPGGEILIEAVGPDAEQAVDALVGLVAAKFDENT